MPRRLAAAVAMLAFVLCLILGRVQARNDFSTTVTRALYAMAVTFGVGLIVGVAGQRMVDETVPKPRSEESLEKQAGSTADDR